MGNISCLKNPASRLIILLLAGIIIISCEREKEDRLPDPDYLIEYELLTEFSTNEIINMIGGAGDLPTGIELLVRYGVSVYRIVYETIDTENNYIPASGALILPKTADPLPLMSFHHGTITREEDAPSYFISDQYMAAAFYSATGFIIALPDYLGYGTSRHLDHPYEHGRSLATASRDMLRAVREFDLRSDEFNISDKLFLTGYSQGGYTTMALLKLLEEEHLTEFSITAATAGAGAYNKTLFAEYLVELDEELEYLNYFLWVLDTYNSVYSIDRPYSYYFNEPHATTIEQYGVFANIEMNPRNLFTTQFIYGIITGDDTEFAEALADNDNYDWKPSTPLQLYHGTDDDFVFYFNSSTAYEAMKARGSGSVELITIEGGNHATTITDYLLGTFLFFSSF